MLLNRITLIICAICLLIFGYFIFNSTTELDMKIKTNDVEKEIHLIVDHQVRDEEEDGLICEHK